VSSEQRTRLDAMLRRPQPEQPPSVEEMRAGFRELMAGMAMPDGFRAEPTTLGGRPALRVEPEAGPRAGTILYLHGGSWVVGSPEITLCLTANLVVRTGFTAYSVDYRLAPEHPFPAAIEDTVAAYRELLERGVDPSTIVFAGDSAGGGLSVTGLLAARDAGLPMPAGILTFSAGLDATRTGASMAGKEGIDPIFTREDFRHTAPMYLGGADPNQPLLSPAVLGDLTGFPPLLLQVGGNEILLDDSTRLAVRARDAGVDVTLDVTAGVPHVFQVFPDILDEAGEALDRAALFLTQRVRSQQKQGRE